METLFQGMQNNRIPYLPLLRSERRGVMPVPANPQETPGQLVIFPERAVERYEDLNWSELELMDVATIALSRHIRRRLLNVDRVVRHVEGYGVPNHVHMVLVPTSESGQSDRIHHPSARLPHDEFADRFAAIQAELQFPEDMFEKELAARKAFFDALIEDAT